MVPKRMGRPRSVQPPKFPDQIVLNELIDRVVALDSADLLNLDLCHRLFVGHDGKRLHGHVRKRRFLRMLCDPDEIVIVFFFRTELKGMIQLDDLDTSLLLLIILHHFPDGLQRGLRILPDGLGNPVQLHRVPHCKKDSFNGRFSLFLFQKCLSLCKI